MQLGSRFWGAFVRVMGFGSAGEFKRCGKAFGPRQAQNGKGGVPNRSKKTAPTEVIEELLLLYHSSR